MKSTYIFTATALFFLFWMITAPVQGQQLRQNYSQLMEIPEVAAMEASPAHLYILSEKDGLAVFRTYPDSLQWLYTSSGMQKRGNTIRADIRFAYLYGDSRRVTVLEPTSVLGVYSSTILPEKPRGVARLNNSLYFALGSRGLGMVSLESPETVDSEIKPVGTSAIGSEAVLDIRSIETTKQLFALTDRPQLLVFDQRDERLELRQRVDLRTPLHRLFIDGEQVWGSAEDGSVYEINTSGIRQKVGETAGEVSHITKWNDRVFIRNATGQLWINNAQGPLELWKSDTNAGNLFAKSSDRLWISENNKISEITAYAATQSTTPRQPAKAFKIKDIPNQTISYPNPLMLGLEMEGAPVQENIEFSYRSTVDNAKIRKQGFVWQPTVNQTGMHRFKIIATNAQGQTDSTSFMVDVRSFNAPPRFSPVRTTTIAVNEGYTLQFNATDPENPQQSLIRYIGVDMPDGAELDEQTGEFSWTPTERQVGETTFKVIATDRFGAATSTEVTLRVRDISRGSED